MRNERRAAQALFLLYAAYACFVFNRTERLVHDDGLVTALAHLINEGRLPFRDFFCGVTPGTFFVQALLQRLFGDEFIVGRVYVLLQHFVLFWVLWRVSVLTIPRGAGRILPVALLFFGPLFSHPFYSLDALLLTSLMLWASVRYVRGGSAWNLYAASTLAALTVLFKQNVGLASVIFIAGMAVWACRFDRRADRPSMSAMAGALDAPLALFGAYLGWSHSTAAFVDNVFQATSLLKAPHIPGNVAAFSIPDRFGLALIAAIVSLIAGQRVPRPWRAVLWSAPVMVFAAAVAEAVARDQRPDRVLTWVQAALADVVMLVPIAVCVVALWLVLKQPSRVRGDPPWLAVLLWFSSLHLIAAATAGVTWYHLSMAFPLVYVLAGRIFSDATASAPRDTADAVVPVVRQRRRALIAVATVLIAYGAVANLFVAAFGERGDSSWRRNPLTALVEMVDPARPGLRGMRLSREYAAELTSVVEFVQARTVPQDEIFAFPMGMPIYLATQRFSTSYYSHFYPEAASPADWNRRTIAYLQTARPKVVVLSEIPSGASTEVREQILSVNGRAVELWNYLETRFVPVRTIGPYVILEHREASREP